MLNREAWQPSKAEMAAGRWRASRNVEMVSRASRLVADAQIGEYERYIRRYAKGKLADIGCGKAPYFGIYAAAVDSIICMDWPQSAHELRHIDLACSLDRNFPLSTGAFDTVLCTDVLEHLFEPQLVWREIARILKPGGVAIIGVPFLYCVHEAPHDHHRYTEYSLARYAEGAGFEIAEITCVGGPHLVVADVLGKTLSRIPFCADLCAGMARLVDSGVSQSARRRFPVAYVLAARKKSIP